MKKTVILLSALIFSLALMIPSLMWADDGKHMEEGSGMKMDKSSAEYKKKHSKEYKDAKGRMKEEGSAVKEEYDKSADHKKMEEGSGMEKKMRMKARQKEGS
jgi:hypothetical protein